MMEDGDHRDHTAMDSINTQTDLQNPPISANQQPGNLGATGQPVPVVTFDRDVIANLIQAASAGQFWDAPGPLKHSVRSHGARTAQHAVRAPARTAYCVCRWTHSMRLVSRWMHRRMMCVHLLLSMWIKRSSRRWNNRPSWASMAS